MEIYNKVYSTFTKDYYSEWPYKDYLQYWEKWQKSMFNKIISHIEIKNKKILDIWCSVWYLINHFNKHWGDAIWIEVSEFCINNNYAKWKISYWEIQNIPYENCVFDITTCVGWVMYYLYYKDIEKAISEIIRVTKEWGYIVISDIYKISSKMKYSKKTNKDKWAIFKLVYTKLDIVNLFIKNWCKVIHNPKNEKIFIMQK